MKLIIVESPAKCKTIEKYLGSNYIVMASKGHVRDLSTRGKGGLGVDIENGFKPDYVIPKSKREIVEQLKKAKSECDEVILATDPDREGEAIAWHLAEVLGLSVKTTKRLEFHEITRDSISHAIENPRTIDLSLVAAQEARRIVDRIIGFKLSGMIQKKIKSRSAGRVQTPTLKLIHDHEKTILEFVPEEYWDLEIKAKTKDGHVFALTLVNSKGESVEIKSEQDAQKVLNSLLEEIEVVNVEKVIRPKESKEPFTTSSLQQEAFAKLKLKTSETAKIAQKLYEGVTLGGDEHTGLITYTRTDSPRLSDTYIAKATNYIIEAFGKEFLGKVKKGKKVTNSQEAHEAIRPTSNHRTPESVQPYLKQNEYNLYKLIYNRALGSLMKPRLDEVYIVTLKSGEYYFKFEMEKTTFKGFEILEKVKEKNQVIVDLEPGDLLTISKKEGKQKFTQPPARYSEAKIVKIMEEVGIGRPSTYAPTIENLTKSKYIIDNRGIVQITEQGSKTAHVVNKYFPEVSKPDYTAKLELHLDGIESGEENRTKVLDSFYKEFIEEVEKANELMYIDQNGGGELLDETCPKCGAKLLKREGKFGDFIGCSNFPKCSYVKKEEKAPAKKTGEFCPKCGKELVERVDRKGKIIHACPDYPKCKYVKPDNIPVESKQTGELTDKVCPKCGAPLLKKKGKYGMFLGCSNYPTCDHKEKYRRNRK